MSVSANNVNISIEPVSTNTMILFLKNLSPFYNFSVWFIIGVIMFLITLALDSPQLIFTLYGSSAFIILMSLTSFFFK